MTVANGGIWSESETVQTWDGIIVR